MCEAVSWEIICSCHLSLFQESVDGTFPQKQTTTPTTMITQYYFKLQFLNAETCRLKGWTWTFTDQLPNFHSCILPLMILSCLASFCTSDHWQFRQALDDQDCTPTRPQVTSIWDSRMGLTHIFSKTILFSWLALFSKKMKILILSFWYYSEPLSDACVRVSWRQH